MRNFTTLAMLTALWTASTALAGPYSLGSSDPTNAYDPAVPGFVGNYVNPEFIGWASECVDYSPTDSWWSGDWDNPVKALGPVTGDEFDIVSLGDLYTLANPPKDEDGNLLPVDPNDLNDEYAFVGIDSPGEITLTFDVPIRNGAGADFAVFENGLYSQWSTPEGSVVGQVHGELGYVQVSTDGMKWLEFASDSLTPEPAPSEYGYGYLTLDPTDVYNLVGKHANAWGVSWGTPFDLDQFINDDDVRDGLVDLQQINYVKIVDIPGSGDFVDGDGDAIYDAWVTLGSGGLDLEALGVLNEMPDFDLDGDIDGDDFDTLRGNLGSADLQYDLDGDGDCDADDMDYMIANNLQWVSGAAGGYGTAAGDFNLDGVVDTTDLTRLATYFGGDELDPRGWGQGNANSDNTIDTTDLTILASNFGWMAPGLAVPAPATIGLLAVGLPAVTRRRKA